MKKVSLLIFSYLSVLLSSCTLRQSSLSYQEIKLSSSFIYSESGRLRFVPNSVDDILLTPFNTVINGVIYLPANTLNSDEVKSVQEEFQFLLQYYYALTDRHHEYFLDGQKINNLKVINDSYGTGQEIKVDDFLYQAIKCSFEFTINSSSLFNIFIGTLNDLYEENIEKAQTEEQSSLNKALTLANNVLFYDDISQEAVSIVTALPTTETDLTDLLIFNDENQTIKFNSLYKDGLKVDKLSISLSGMAKGLATEVLSDYFSQEIPNANIFIDSGSSSVKATGGRPDDRPWKIAYMNPLYGEAIDKSQFNRAEVAFDIRGTFTMSTSGYYQNYFYVYDGDDEYHRRSHIIDPHTGLSVNYIDQVTVFLDDAMLADMYTTALMNTSSVNEALDLFAKLNDIYDQDQAEIILCVKEKDDLFYTYHMSDLDRLSKHRLPITKLTDGSVYDGDYSTISSSLIDSSISVPKRDFNLIYYMSSGIKDKSSLITDETIVSSNKKRYAIIEEMV